MTSPIVMAEDEMHTELQFGHTLQSRKLQGIMRTPMPIWQSSNSSRPCPFRPISSCSLSKEPRWYHQCLIQQSTDAQRCPLRHFLGCLFDFERRSATAVARLRGFRKGSFGRTWRTDNFGPSTPDTADGIFGTS